MADTNSPKLVAAEVPIDDGINSLMPPRRELRDVAALLALPEMWVDQDPADIAAGLLDVLFRVLGLKSAYERFDDPGSGPALEYWRPNGPRVPNELEPLLTAAPPRKRGTVTMSVAEQSGEDAVRVVSMSPSLPGENGLVLVSSLRADFPTDLEVYLLRIAVGQATISIHAARKLANERAARLATEAELLRRNAFLATLAQELELPLAMLGKRAAQAHALTTESDQAVVPTAVPDATLANTGHVSRRQASTPPLAPSAQLTRREAEVLGLLAQGMSNKEIAEVLLLSERTIERHITGLYGKIQVQRRSEATAFAFRHGLIDLGVEEA